MEPALANYDCLAFTETWLNDNFSSCELFDDSYSVFRSDRTVDKYNILYTSLGGHHLIMYELTLTNFLTLLTRVNHTQDS